MDRKLRVNFPPDPNPSPLRFSPPAGACDTHFHVWGPPHHFPYAETRQYTPPSCPIEHYFSVAALLGLERGVIVQSNVHGLRTASTVDALRKAEGRLRGIVRPDPDLSDDDLRRLDAEGVRGVRLTLIPRLGGGFDPEQFRSFATRLAALEWVLDLHLEADAIDASAQMISEAPVPVVIDHFGGTDAKGGPSEPAFRTLLDLVALPHVWVKVSAANRRLASGTSYEDVVACARALIDAAPDRVLWGTDWPHSGVFEAGQAPNDGDLMNMLVDFAPDAAARRRVLADNPSRLFGFG